MGTGNVCPVNGGIDRMARGDWRGEGVNTYTLL